MSYFMGHVPKDIIVKISRVCSCYSYTTAKAHIAKAT